MCLALNPLSLCTHTKLKTKLSETICVLPAAIREAATLVSQPGTGSLLSPIYVPGIHPKQESSLQDVSQLIISLS